MICHPPLFLFAGCTLLLACATGGRFPAPEQPRAPGTATAATRLTVVTLNIWHDRDDWPSRLDFMVRGLQDLNPDVICLQEVLQNENLPNQALTIAEQLGYSVHFASVDTPGSAKRYGNAILTRYPVLIQNDHRLQPLTDYRVAAHVRIRVGTDSVDIYNTHLHHAAQGGDGVRRTQLLDLLDFIEATRAHGPVILAGDFNAPVTAPEMRTLIGLFVSAFDAFHSRTDASTLNPAKGHQPVRIDHILYGHGPARAVRPVRADIILDSPDDAGVWASDHYGVMASFEIPGW